MSCLSGVSTTGQSSSQETPTTVMAPSPKLAVSKAPGRLRRRSTISPTSISGEMMTSMGMFSRENRSCQWDSR